MPEVADLISHQGKPAFKARRQTGKVLLKRRIIEAKRHCSKAVSTAIKAAEATP